MRISYEAKLKQFHLNTNRSSYIFAVIDEGTLAHVYYGKRLQSTLGTHDFLRTEESPFIPSQNDRDRISFNDSYPAEYPTAGIGDYRPACLSVRTPEGYEACHLLYTGHRIRKDKPILPGLPSTFAGDVQAETLEVVCEDKCIGLRVTLLYTVFADVDVIIRSTRIENIGVGPLFLTRALSACVEFDGVDRDILTLHGSWARERHIKRSPAVYGSYSTGSVRGEPGHQEHPFLGVLSKNATQSSGCIVGIHLVYSGNFLAEAHGSQFDALRVTIGIHPDQFNWKLMPGDTFQTPECVLVFSDEGIGGMTRTLHDLYRNHLIRSKYRDQNRPVVLNSWEAVYFDIHRDKLLRMAQAAGEAGVGIFVLDDGWFGKRESDNSSLGDWTVNEKKLPGGLSSLGQEINALGMGFGIWIEPEMVSPDSDLYRAHPDWAIAIPNRRPGLARNQLVLDLSREDVREYIWTSIQKICSSAPISYVKWDMNRPLSDLGSALLPADRQGELCHRYALGLYELAERFVQSFPDILLESCSGGGARFDPGMLYYSPQIWCSDNTDAVERLSIQEGTALLYPLSCIGSHVSDCPNHTVHRTTPFETRALVAMAGTFGYELDITSLSEEQRQEIPRQIERYQRCAPLIRDGDYYRLASYSENGAYDCWQIVSKDRKETIVTYIQVKACANQRSRRVRLSGLLPQGQNHLQGTDKSYGGDVLMYGGYSFRPLVGDAAGVFCAFNWEE